MNKIRLIFEIADCESFSYSAFVSNVLACNGVINGVTLSVNISLYYVTVVIDSSIVLSKLNEFRLIRTIVSLERSFPIQIISIS